MTGDLERQVRASLQEMADRVDPAADSWSSIEARAGIRHRSRRTVPVAVAAGILLVVATVAGLIAGRDDPTLTTNPAWSVDELQGRERLRIDPSFRSNGVPPRTKLASDGSQVWFSRLGSTKIAHLDPVSASVVSTAETMLPLVGVAVAPDSVWGVAIGYTEVVRVDRESGAVTRVELRSGEQPRAAMGGIAYGDRAVWVPVSGDGLARIDLETGATEVIDLGAQVRYVTAGGGSVWGVGDTGAVIAFDSQRRTVTARAELGVGEYYIEHGESAVWVLDARGELIRLPPDLRSEHRIAVGPDPHDLATGAGAVWVTDELDGTLLVVDPDSLVVRTEVDIGGTPGDVVVAGDQIWISDPNTGTLVSVVLR